MHPRPGGGGHLGNTIRRDRKRLTSARTGFAPGEEEGKGEQVSLPTLCAGQRRALPWPDT